MQLLVSKLERIIKKEQTVVSVAQELSVSRQTVHKHLLRYKRFGEDGIRRAQTVRRHKQAHNRTTEALERCVIECQNVTVVKRWGFVVVVVRCMLKIWGEVFGP